MVCVFTLGCGQSSSHVCFFLRTGWADIQVSASGLLYYSEWPFFNFTTSYGKFYFNWCSLESNTQLVWKNHPTYSLLIPVITFRYISPQPLFFVEKLRFLNSLKAQNSHVFSSAGRRVCTHFCMGSDSCCESSLGLNLGFLWTASASWTTRLSLEAIILKFPVPLI